jgi:DNA end-binding protein Ku
MFCPKQETLVPPEEIVRGYEIEPGRYLPVTDEELESVSPERSRTIEIVEFIDMDEVDPLYYDHPYYLVPMKGGEKAYRLLAEALRQTNRAGLAKFVLAEREHLVAVRCREGALTLVTLHYREELLPATAPPTGERTDIGMKERIARMLTGFDPAKYADARREKLLDLLKRKAEETAPVEAPQVAADEGEGPPDLVAALEVIMREVKKNR